MENRDDSLVVPAPVYDVVLAGKSPDALRNRFPTMKFWVIGAQTALRRRVSEPAQLRVLLEKLWLLGLPLLEVHRLPCVAGEGEMYEVRVEGEIGEPLLRYLRWPHHVMPGQARVRVVAVSSELHQFLRACTESGARIQRVRMVDTTRRRQPAFL